MPANPLQITIDIPTILSERGLGIVQATPSAPLLRLIAELKPVSTEFELIRIGGPNDGGYLLPDCLDQISACFSPGVGPTSSFEQDLATRGIRSLMADFSVDRPATDNPLFTFEKKFVGDTNDDQTIRLEDWVERHAGKVDTDLLLQMDIEGAEYQVILDTPAVTLRQFKVICIEFHRLDSLFVAPIFPFFEQVFRKLLNDFWVIHLHPNNAGKISSRNGIEIPTVLEFTFLRRDAALPVGRQLSFPHELDAPNLTQVMNLVLPRCWWPDRGMIA